jgi:hypothetical protein
MDVQQHYWGLRTALCCAHAGMEVFRVLGWCSLAGCGSLPYLSAVAVTSVMSCGDAGPTLR